MEGITMELSGELILGICSALGASFIGGCGWVWSLARKMAEQERRWEDAEKTRAELHELKRELHDYRADERRQLDEIRAAISKASHQFASIDAKMTMMFAILSTKGEKVDMATVVDALESAGARGK